MMRRFFYLVLAFGLLALAACAAEEKATPAPASPGAGATPSVQEEWERVVAAAKREGKVAIAGPAGPAVRQGMTEPFEKKYGISVEYLPMRGPEFVEKVRAERGAGQYLWDIYVGSPVNVYVYKELSSALDPLDPALILPEVKDGKNWQGGQLLFADKGRTTLVMVTYATEAFGYNTKQVDPKEFKSYKDLLNPKWKGKMAIYNPTVPGAGDAKLAFFQLHPDLGPDFIRALAKDQEVIAMANVEQMMDWLANGRVAIVLGASKVAGAEFKKQGLIDYADPKNMKEGGSVHVGVGAVALFNKAPHPNAAKVYINWLLSKEGATEFAKAGPYPSLRVDVPSFVDPYEVAQPNYMRLDTEEGSNVRVTVREAAKDLFTLR